MKKIIFTALGLLFISGIALAQVVPTKCVCPTECPIGSHCICPPGGVPKCVPVVPQLPCRPPRGGCGPNTIWVPAACECVPKPIHIPPGNGPVNGPAS